ncbi:MAG: hypothetical protein ACPGJS_05980 [Flammeovirgaceae bacterium]
MKQLIIVVLLIVFVSCTSGSLTRIKFNPVRGGVKCHLLIPKNYELERISGHGNRFSYTYQDSSMIYISTFNNTPNYDNLRSQGTYYTKWFAQKSDSSLVLSGEDSLGLYWKDITEGVLSIGYMNVSKQQKALFDSALNSLKYEKYKPK